MREDNMRLTTFLQPLPFNHNTYDHSDHSSRSVSWQYWTRPTRRQLQYIITAQYSSVQSIVVWNLQPLDFQYRDSRLGAIRISKLWLLEVAQGYLFMFLIWKWGYTCIAKWGIAHSTINTKFYSIQLRVCFAFQFWLVMYAII